MVFGKKDEINDDVDIDSTKIKQFYSADESGNKIEQVTADVANVKDDIPSVNQLGRDVGNANNFKIMVLFVVGIVIILIGIAMSIGRFQQSRAEDKAKEVEKLAQEQKKMATATKVDIEADKAEMLLHELLPSVTNATLMENTDTGETEQLKSEQKEIIVQPKQPEYQPQYKDYSGDVAEDSNYIAPLPVQQPTTPQPQPMDSFDDEPQQALPVYAEAEITEHSSVLVDVYGSKAPSDTQLQETELESYLKSSQLSNGSVSKRRNQTMLLVRGTTIPCVLKTRIDSTYQGFATCQLTKDVYSANGKVLLMERGSTVFGEQNIQMSQGKARVSILWSKVETPKGISVSLDSPATEQLGEMGIGAKVNNHFWKRFGGAIMLSVIQDGFLIARSHLEKKNTNNNTTHVTNTTNTAERMSEEILSNTINIPPTAIVNQGTVINIMVVRDVDFSSIYSVVRR